MKLSELSAREYIAIEFLPGIMQDRRAFGGTFDDNSEQNSKYALRMADAFLRVAGREKELHAHTVAQMQKHIDAAETTNSLLLNMNEDGNFSARVALLQIWEMLGVSNQTAATIALSALQVLANDRA